EYISPAPPRGAAAGVARDSCGRYMSQAGSSTRSAASDLPDVTGATRMAEDDDGAKKEASGMKGFRGASTEGGAREGGCRRLNSRLISRKRKRCASASLAAMRAPIQSPAASRSRRSRTAAPTFANSVCAWLSSAVADGGEAWAAARQATATATMRVLKERCGTIVIA